MSFNFPALPYLVQKRFAELVDTKTAEKFFQTSQSNASFAKQRIIIKDLEIFFFTRPSYTPRIKDCKEVEVAEKLTLKSIGCFSAEEIFPMLPLYYGNLHIFEETIIFATFKALIEHKNLTDVYYSGFMLFARPFSDEPEISAKVFNEFFDRLTKIRRIRLYLSLSSRNDKNSNLFVETSKKYEKSLKIVNTSRMVIFTRKVKRRSVYELCKSLKNSFIFVDKPLSFEESEYPLAYGAIVYKDITQVTYLLSSIYRPNNIYIFMVDKKATNDFKRQIKLFSDCFSNVFIEFAPAIQWGGYEIARSVFKMVQFLSDSKYEWKYFQYLSGFDLPLKTNLEMVRIFKELNGTFNAEIEKFPNGRLKTNNLTSPMPLFKSSLSATFSRESANYMSSSPLVHQLLTFLENIEIPDESVWATIAGNPEILAIPGKFNGKEMLEKRVQDFSKVKNEFGHPNFTRPNNDTFVPSSYYISRYQRWGSTDKDEGCKGKYIASSCVYGVEDLQVLISRPELLFTNFIWTLNQRHIFVFYNIIGNER